MLLIHRAILVFGFLSILGAKSGQGCPSYGGVLGLSVRAYRRTK